MTGGGGGGAQEGGGAVGSYYRDPDPSVPSSPLLFFPSSLSFSLSLSLSIPPLFELQMHLHLGDRQEEFAAVLLFIIGGSGNTPHCQPNPLLLHLVPGRGVPRPRHRPRLSPGAPSPGSPQMFQGPDGVLTLPLAGLGSLLTRRQRRPHRLICGPSLFPSIAVPLSLALALLSSSVPSLQHTFSFILSAPPLRSLSFHLSVFPFLSISFTCSPSLPFHCSFTPSLHPSPSLSLLPLVASLSVEPVH